MDEKQQTPNNLIHEASPYLVQHAYNPVDWYPWGDEAFAKAVAEDKPIFLSIGYSTCHWCHVMAHESFEDEGAAAVLNAGFVSIKVDREQRPDIDEVYMSVCQAMTGSGGWPLSIFMTADKKPFFAGTYLPTQSAYGRVGFIELCTNILRLWDDDRQSLLKNSAAIIDHLSKQRTQSGAPVDTEVLINRGYSNLKGSFDSTYGGFSQSPKFPSPHNILFLLQYSKAKGDAAALHMAEHTLVQMYRGGIYDHIGGGFSRYSTDGEWLVPHFEKMLYDNAMHLLAYSEAFSLTKNQVYKPIIDGIATYVLRDMRSSSGGFYSAEDADSEGEEGRFYVFGYDELEAALSLDELRLLEQNFGVSRQGNFEGTNILHIMGRGDDCGAILQKLYDVRDKRIRPFKDTKISISWNGLMIEALCRAGEVTGNRDYIDSAKKAVDFILEKARENGELFGIHKDGAQPTKAFLADYANFANGLIALYLATTELAYLKEAKSLAVHMVSLFWEDEQNRFYMTRKGDKELFVRPKDEYDGAMPSGTSCAIRCLGSLVKLTGDADLSGMFDKAVAAFLSTAASIPSAFVHFLSSLFDNTVVHRQVIITANKDNDEARSVYNRLLKEYRPFTTLIFYDGSAQAKAIFPELSRYDASKPFAAYVCENFACQSPIYSPVELIKQLGLAAE
ncbi:MAG: thioredoxin domain-containing protein [Clostridiales bacterium]|nr:thioredoxin domain-containing protein [Clostridiales bacterium]